VIEISKLSLRFGEKVVFEDFSAKLPSDTITCVTGKSGRGKTTLLRLIAGLLKPDGGTLTGTPRKPAVMFQEDRLLPWLSAVQNAAAVSDYDTAMSWLEKLGLGGDADTLPAGLSGGMSRRAALARALAYDGDFLLLDEPFTGLDPAMTRVTASVIKSRGLPALVITHSSVETDLLGGNFVEL